MKHSDTKSKKRSRPGRSRLVHRCLSMLLALSTVTTMTLSDYDFLSKVGAADDTVPPVTEPEDNNPLLAYFEFDEAENRFKDKSGKNVSATLVNPSGTYIIGTDDDGNNYLDLTKSSDAYLSLSGSILKGLTEMTVEMRVLTKDTKANWPFFAAPNNEKPGDDPTYLGVLLKNEQVKVERFANGREHEEDFYGDWTVGEWHKIRVAFEKNSTTLYIDDNEIITQESQNSLADCLGEDPVLWFGHSSWDEYFNGYIDNIVISGKSDGDTEEKVIAKLDFEDDNGGVLSDKSGNNTELNAVAVKGLAENISDFFKTEDGKTYLELTDRSAYLSLKNADGSGVLTNMAEVTVEMRLKTAISSNGKTQWAFYAAPNASKPGRSDDRNLTNEHYLSIHLDKDAAGAVARRYKKVRPEGTPNEGGLSAALGQPGWYTVKVFYEAGKTTLSVKKDGEDEVQVVCATDLSANVWDCVGDVLWFGYSGWGEEEYFNGCIDYIKIRGTTIDERKNNAQAVENEHIITKNVVDPANTTVNMFDYWTFISQSATDYGWGTGKTIDELINNGINKGHLFLFDGSASFDGGDSSTLGIWNNYSGTGVSGFESKWGIVQKRLLNGYPQLALNNGNWAEPANSTLSGLWNTDGKQTESLDYLFTTDDSNTDGKMSYPNVTGLFRLDDEGYYYFRSQDVFAELNADQNRLPKTSTAANRITLYDTPWREEYARGQFFPFNDWTDLFYEVNGHIGQWGDQTYQRNLQSMNHWFGMTIETKLMQPANGMLNNNTTPMTFEFSGDDDVWIFIDDVLVADVGGNHSRIRVTIDFSDGKIIYKKQLQYDGLDSNPGLANNGIFKETTLYEVFCEADSEGNTTWNGNTFADGTLHTLKFFYLERGNAASNCNIRFNLQEPIVDRIRKVDQNGDPLAGAEFKLYKADPRVNIGNEWWKHTADDFVKGDLVTTAVSDSSGYAPLTTANGEPLNLTQSTYYILEETGTPKGYSKNPPIVLQYHRSTNTLTVVNKYEAGAYASFIAEWASLSDICCAKYDNNNGTFSRDLSQGFVTDLEKGLAIVVPVIKSGDPSAFWQPMYGSNTLGWNTVMPNTNSEDGLINALAKAALMQIADPDPKTQHWYLSWNGAQLKGKMENLPGDATRYVFNGGTDGDLVTLFLPETALKKLGLNGSYADDNDRYAALCEALEGKSAQTLAGLANQLSDLKILYTEGFAKASRTVIYVPNEQRELRVRKVDEKNNPINGAVFALFRNVNDAAAGLTTSFVASGMTDKNGELVFRANVTNAAGYASMDWDSGRADGATVVYWLKEIAAPTGYELNTSLIRVVVDDTGIYANATGFDPAGNLLTGEAAKNDGVKVEASLGRLTQTLVKYAEGIVDETLKHITAAKQTANNNSGALSWADANGADDSKNLIYNKADGYGSVMFEAENGYVRVMPRQTNGITSAGAKRDDLTNVDLDGLFSLINTVVVTDPHETGSLTVSKTVVIPDAPDDGETDDDTEFSFTVTLGDATFNRTYTFTNNKTITFTNGVAEFTLHHGESVTFTGLPTGITYTVAEDKAEGYTTDSDGAIGTIIANTDAKAEFTNTKIPDPPTGMGNLTVKKTVTGIGDKNKSFTFTVTLFGEGAGNISGTYGEMIFQNGTATFTLKDGDSKTAAGLPAGLTYKVTESDNNGYTVTSAGDTGEISENKTVTAAFTNHIEPPKTGSLTVSKTVKAPDGGKIDTEAEFSFTVTLGDTSFNHTYSFTNGKDITFTDGVAEFTLRHGESVTFTELPLGVTYTVAEDEDTAEGYTVTSAGAIGTIPADNTAKAEFTNTKIEQSDSTPEENNTPDDPDNSDQEENNNTPDEPDDSSTPDDSPHTGFETDLGFRLAVMALALIAAAAAVNLLRKRGKHRK